MPELLDNSTEMPQYANTSEAVMMTQMDVFQQQQQNPTSVMLSPPPPPLTGVYPLQEVAEEVDENEMWMWNKANKNATAWVGEWKKQQQLELRLIFQFTQHVTRSCHEELASDKSKIHKQ